MIALWIAAALMSAAVGGLILHRANLAAARAAAGGEDPALAVYRRQLTEVDDLAERGLLDAQERRSARAEAARRLLTAADAAPGRPISEVSGRRAVLVASALAPVAAFGLYLLLGSPQTPDQPYRARLAAWRAADPDSLTVPQITAVLRAVAAERPKDPLALANLARAEAATGDGLTAERNLRHALALDPRDGVLWDLYGRVLAQDDGGGDRLSAAARDAFRKAQALAPQDPGPTYLLARDAIASGQVAPGLATLKALLGALQPQDPRRAELTHEIDGVARTGALPSDQTAPDQDQGQGQGLSAMIQQMVQGLAQRLDAHPDDPAGWARLVRAYVVLGDTGRRDAALARARSLFAGRPQDLAPIEAAARSQPDATAAPPSAAQPNPARSAP